MDEILWCYHSNETSLAIHLNRILNFLVSFLLVTMKKLSPLQRPPVLWGGWEEKKRECAGEPRTLSISSIITILIGIPSGSLCGGERSRKKRLRYVLFRYYVACVTDVI